MLGSRVRRWAQLQWPPPHLKGEFVVPSGFEPVVVEAPQALACQVEVCKLRRCWHRHTDSFESNALLTTVPGCLIYRRWIRDGRGRAQMPASIIQMLSSHRNIWQSGSQRKSACKTLLSWPLQRSKCSLRHRLFEIHLSYRAHRELEGPLCAGRMASDRGRSPSASLADTEEDDEDFLIEDNSDDADNSDSDTDGSQASASELSGLVPGQPFAGVPGALPSFSRCHTFI